MLGITYGSRLNITIYLGSGLLVFFMTSIYICVSITKTHPVKFTVMRLMISIGILI